MIEKTEFTHCFFSPIARGIMHACLVRQFTFSGKRCFVPLVGMSTFNRGRGGIVVAKCLPPMWLVCLPPMWLVCLPPMWLVCLPPMWLVCLPPMWFVCLGPPCGLCVWALHVVSVSVPSMWLVCQSPPCG